MVTTSLFFDTYAFFEVAVGNPNYAKFTQGIAIVTTRLNLMELFYGLLVRYGRKVASEHYDALRTYCIEPDDATVKEAMLFRARNRRRKLSYVDALGYVMAMQRAIPFLTGDRQFTTLPNVLFVR